MDQVELLEILRHYNEQHAPAAELPDPPAPAEADDLLDQELAATFPASDPLSFWSG